MSSSQRIARRDLETLVRRAFEVSNVETSIAACVAATLVRAEVDGRKGHGLSRVPSYAAQARSGKVDGHVTPSFTQVKTASLLIDTCHGFAYPAFELAKQRLPDLAGKTGIASAGFVRSHHFGVAGHHVEDLADSGLVALAVGNTPKAMAPWGGRAALFGTNPIAFAAPRATGQPFVIDLALSEVARGNIMKAARTGQAIPHGWALDEDGQPTNDARAALDGTMVPAGGAKGAALALMVEVLAAALTGANYAYEASSFFTEDGPPPGVGQLLVVFDPGAFGDASHVLQRIEVLCAAIESEPGARLPGGRRSELRRMAEADGVEVDAGLLAEIHGLVNG